MRKVALGLAAAFVLGICASRADAHGVVGQRRFIEPFVTEDVNPKNEFVIARPEWLDSSEGHGLSEGFSLEKKLADRLSLTLDSAWLHISPKASDEPSESGFDNLGITLKYAFFMNPDRESIASFAVESTAPTGSEDIGAEKYWAFKPFFLYGRGLGDLPDSLRYLRPFALQGDFGPEVSTGPGTATTFAHNVCLEYSIPYLQAVVRDFGIRWPLNDMIAVTEFNFEHGVHGEESGINLISMTPGIVYMDGYVEIGVAARVPLSGDARDEFDWGLIGIVDLFIDDILPWTRWQPF
jgi:hypothetical protein